MLEIFYSKDKLNIKKNFVAIGCELNGVCNPAHSIMVMQFENELFEFHYTGKDVVLDNLKSNCFYRVTKVIHPDEVAAFIALCKSIEKNSNPQYGFFYSGQSYDKNGVHLSQIELGERMTCVGFCLNVLKSFLGDDYLVYSDWTSDSDAALLYFNKFCKDNNLEPKKMKKHFRRIPPLDFFSSCFYNTYPITKAQVDFNKSNVYNFLKLNCLKISISAN